MGLVDRTVTAQRLVRIQSERIRVFQLKGRQLPDAVVRLKLVRHRSVGFIWPRQGLLSHLIAHRARRIVAVTHSSNAAGRSGTAAKCRVAGPLHLR